MEVSSSINAIQTNMNSFENNAVKISEGVENPADFARLLTDNISLEVGIDAQIRSIKTQEEVMGTLLDMMA